MRCRFAWLVFASLAFACACSAAVAADEQPGQTGGINAKNLVPAGTVQGTLTKVSESGKYLTIRYNVKVQKPNPQFDPKRPFIIEDKPVEAEFLMTDDVKVRVPLPPPEIDPKTGKIKVLPKPDPKDPDSKLPGLKAEPGVLKDMINGDVTVTLSRDKTDKGKPPKTYVTLVLVTKPPEKPRE